LALGKENYSMGNMLSAVRILLVAGALAASFTGCGDSSSTSSSTSNAKTAAWTNVTVRALDGKINVSWDRATGSAFGSSVPVYNIYCSTNPATIMQPSNRIATQYAGTSFDHTDVTNGVVYYYVVTEVSAAGESTATRIVSASPQAQLPAAPYGLKVTALDSSVNLELLGPTSAGVTGYNLYRSTSRLFTAETTVKTPLTTFTAPYADQNLNNGTTYFYAVSAVSAGKESAFSPTSAARPQAKTATVNSSPTQLAAFASPTDMSAQAGNSSCTIKWSDVAPLVISAPDPATATSPYYVLYWSDSPDVLANFRGKSDDATKLLTKDANGAYTCKLNGLTNGITYYVQLTAGVKGAGGLPAAGRVTAGPIVAVTPGLKTPATPGGVSATQGTQQVLLSWNKDSSGVTGITYNIYVSTTAAATPTELMAKGTRKNNSDSSKTYFTHSGLQSGQTYYYVVTAVGEGESAPSSVVAVTL
jgi:fibronectin type 3 domain-containing protein